jgi:phosphoserine/homoserine phosphotransferase
MYIVCSDLEGVFVPEIWINVAARTGIDELKLTTRDISDYDVLMKRRISILRENNLTIHDIREAIATMKPLPGALEFLDWLRSKVQLILVSDTFTEFADPLMAQMGRPTLFCNSLSIDTAGMITGYNLRQKDGKRKVAEAMQGLSFRVIAVGDSYNDISMIRKADKGILFRPPVKVITENPDLPVVNSYEELKQLIIKEAGIREN